MKLLKVKRVVSAAVGEIPLKENGGTFRPSSFKRETQNAEVAENIGYTETPQAAELKVTVNASLDPSVFANLADDTLNIYLDGGGQHVMPRAWVTEPPELGNGEYSVTFNCGKSQKLA